MNIRMKVTYCHTLSVNDYCFLRKSVGFHEIPEQTVKLALERSDYIVAAAVDGVTVGMARLITDGIQVLIMDVVVHPNYQKKSIGRGLMEQVMEYIENMEYKQVFVNLLTDKIGFYEKLGFSKASTEGAEGMWMELFKS